MNDWILNLGVTGQEKAVGALKEIASQANEADKSADRQRRRLEQINALRKKGGDYARHERKEAFDRLSIEEKLLRLQRQRERISDRLARAAGNELRAAQLRLKLAHTDSQLRMLGGGGATGAAIGGFLGGLGSRFAGGIGALVGTASLLRYSLGRLQRANQLGDTSEITGLSVEELLRVKDAAMGLGGERVERGAMSAFAQLGAVRANAVGGDKSARRLFEDLRIPKEMLGGDASNLDVATAIKRTLGAGHPGDAAALRTLFGRSYQQTFALLGAMESTGAEAGQQAASTVRTLSRSQHEIEKAQYEIGNWWDRMIGAVAGSWNKLRAEQKAEIDKARAQRGMPPLQPAAGVPPLPRLARLNPGSVIGTPPSAAMDGVMPASDALIRTGLFRGGVDARPYFAEFNSHLREIRAEIAQVKMVLSQGGPPYL